MQTFIAQTFIATVSILAVVALAWQGIINGDAAVGTLGLVLGYVFGKATEPAGLHSGQGQAGGAGGVGGLGGAGGAGGAGSKPGQ